MCHQFDYWGKHPPLFWDLSQNPHYQTACHSSIVKHEKTHSIVPPDRAQGEQAHCFHQNKSSIYKTTWSRKKRINITFKSHSSGLCQICAAVPEVDAVPVKWDVGWACVRVRVCRCTLTLILVLTFFFPTILTHYVVLSLGDLVVLIPVSSK